MFHLPFFLARWWEIGVWVSESDDPKTNSSPCSGVCLRGLVSWRMVGFFVGS